MHTYWETDDTLKNIAEWYVYLIVPLHWRKVRHFLILNIDRRPNEKLAVTTRYEQRKFIVKTAWNCFCLSGSIVPLVLRRWIFTNVISPHSTKNINLSNILCLRDPRTIQFIYNSIRNNKTLINNFSQAGVEVGQVSAGWKKNKRLTCQVMG